MLHDRRRRAEAPQHAGQREVQHEGVEPRDRASGSTRRAPPRSRTTSAKNGIVTSRIASIGAQYRKTRRRAWRRPRGRPGVAVSSSVFSQTPTPPCQALVPAVLADSSAACGALVDVSRRTSSTCCSCSILRDRRLRAASGPGRHRWPRRPRWSSTCAAASASRRRNAPLDGARRRLRGRGAAEGPAARRAARARRRRRGSEDPSAGPRARRARRAGLRDPARGRRGARALQGERQAGRRLRLGYDQRAVLPRRARRRGLPAPAGQRLLEGLGRYRIYYKDALDKLGVDASTCSASASTSPRPSPTCRRAVAGSARGRPCSTATCGSYLADVAKARKLRAGAMRAASTSCRSARRAPAATSRSSRSTRSSSTG